MYAVSRFIHLRFVRSHSCGMFDYVCVFIWCVCDDPALGYICLDTNVNGYLIGAASIYDWCVTKKTGGALLWTLDGAYIVSVIS